MLQSRIREIRKAKKLTLKEVADRAGTTAQTIGRLETGMRTLSINWVQRIADALDADAGELLSLPEGGDIAVSGVVANNGEVVETNIGVLALRFTAENPIAIRMQTNLGQYQQGDHVICDRLQTTDSHRAHGKDCLVNTTDNKYHFAKVLRGSNDDSVTLVPIAPQGDVITDCHYNFLAPAVSLVRSLK